jgi:hypothetical protein
MRPGMQRLLELLRGQGAACEVSETEWMTVLDLAAKENVLLWVAARLRTTARPSMPMLDERLREVERNGRIAAFLWRSNLRSLLAAFHENGMPVIPLKGPWLAERVYGDAALRSYSDLDLLIRRSEIAGAECLLTGLGFRPAGRRDDYERPWYRGELWIELHHDVENPLAFDAGIDAVWRRARLAEFEGVPAWLLAPSDELLFLCLHGTRHCFERLSHVLDLALGFRQLRVPRGETGLRRSPESGNILALGAMMAARLDPGLSISVDVLERVRNRGSLEELADRVWRERMLQPAAPVDWRIKHGFYLKIETSGWRRFVRGLRHLRILLTRVIDADFAFAERFKLRQTWQVWLLRPVRLVLTSVRAAPAGP